nr:MAG TPA: hypothetical protein [Caudoviricetes sp.]
MTSHRFFPPSGYGGATSVSVLSPQRIRSVTRTSAR